MDLVTGKCRPGKVSRTVCTSPLMLDLTVMCIPGTGVLRQGAAAQGVLPPWLIQCQRLIQVRRPLQRRLQWWDSRNQRPRTFRHSGCRSPQTCFHHSDYRPRLPHPRCRGEQQKTRRRHFHPTGCVRGTLRMFRTRVVCSMCRRFRQDLSFGLFGERSGPV